jgi:soluble cytochrome b562
MPADVTRLLSLVVVLMSIGLVACGDDDGGSAPSKQEFANDAERICKDTEKALENFGESVNSAEDAADAIDKVIERARKAADDLANLDRPEGETGETATKFAEGFKSELEDKLVPALEDLKSALQSGDPQKIQQAASKLQGLEATESDRYARQLGIRACAGAA